MQLPGTLPGSEWTMPRRILLNVFGLIFTFSGFWWMGQGAGYLPGRLMRGDPQWILWGALTAAFGLVLLYFANRRPPAS